MLSIFFPFNTPKTTNSLYLFFLIKKKTQTFFSIVVYKTYISLKKHNAIIK